ncbi:MAG: LexA family transcriptional regulator [Bacteroidetes bacterium]|nr:LexA family transcriptional regulator [Bacteroidota bacterium]
MQNLLKRLSKSITNQNYLFFDTILLKNRSFFKQCIKILTLSVFRVIFLHNFTQKFYYNFMFHLKTLRKKSKLSREQIAKILDVSFGTYGKIERGGGRLTTDRINKLAEIHRVSIEYIMTGKEKSNNSLPAENFNVTYIPISSRAGLLTEIESKVEFERFFIPMIQGSDLYMLKVEGDSMYPTLSHGDGVIVKRQDTPSLNWGEIFVIDTLDGVAVKRVFMNEDKKKYTLKSDNVCYPEYTVDKNELRALWHVKGVLSQNLCQKYMGPSSKN